MAYVDLVRYGRTLEIGLNKAPVNSIDSEFSKDIHAALKQLQDDPGLSVGIIHSLQPKAFSAGWDLKAAASEGAGGGFQMTDAEGQDVFGAGGFAGITEFWGLNKPVIAALDAPAVGGGFEIALACDIIVASEKVYFQLPEMARGILPDAGGVQRLPRLVPRNVAREMLFTGRRMQADEAARWGLVRDVVPAGQALTRARALAVDIALGAPLALAALKEALALTETMDMRQSIEVFRDPRRTPHRGLSAHDGVRGCDRRGDRVLRKA
jgi:crotonobetainyl-CoA hydratase